MSMYTFLFPNQNNEGMMKMLIVELISFTADQYKHLFILFFSNHLMMIILDIFIIIMFILAFRPDMTFAVDWALSNNYLSFSIFTVFWR